MILNKTKKTKNLPPTKETKKIKNITKDKLTTKLPLKLLMKPST